MISVQNISKSYGTALVVDDVSLEIPKGGVTALIGPNGAGKSTLLSMMSRLLAPSAGTTLIDGLDVASTPSDVLAKRISILKQDNHIATRLTVADLVGFGRYPHTKGRPTIADSQEIDKALAYLNLEDLAHRYLDELSGGQRQRAYVAMVLAQDTDYLLLDEPLNNLDIKHAVAMMKLVRRAATELNKTVIVVLHDINFASCYADHIIIMRDGKIAHQGTPAEIITPQIIRETYEIDIQVHDIAGQLISVFYG